jgi:hypothetical protein
MIVRRVVWLLTAAVVAACGGGYKIRPINLDESAVLQIAADPLVRQAGLRRCTMAVTLNDVASRALEVLPGPTAEFEHSRAASTSSGSSRALARGYTATRNYTAEEETSADRQAARLLTTAAGSAACAGLARVLERSSAEGERWSDWTDQHPLTPGRAAAARTLC